MTSSGLFIRGGLLSFPLLAVLVEHRAPKCKFGTFDKPLRLVVCGVMPNGIIVTSCTVELPNFLPPAGVFNRSSA